MNVRTRQKTVSTKRRLLFERLEHRQLLAGFTWNGGIGNFSDETQWTPQLNDPPGASDNAFFNTDSHVTFTANAETKELTIREGDMIFDLGGNTYLVGASGVTNIGTDADATLLLQGTGTWKTASSAYVGLEKQGVITLSGAGLQWEADLLLAIGVTGDGIVNVLNSAHLFAAETYVASQEKGTLNLTDAYASASVAHQ